MGVAASTVAAQFEEAQKQSDSTEKQVTADLNNLTMLLGAKAQEYMSKLVTNKGEDKSVPIKTIVDYKIHTSVSVSTEPSSQLNSALEEMFGGNFLSALKAVCIAALNNVLGNSHAGEKVETGYKLMLLNSAVVRVDYYVYGFNMFTGNGLVDKRKNGIAFVAVVGVIDLQQIGLETLVYLVGQQANQATSFLKAREELWESRRQQLDKLEKANDKITVEVLRDLWLPSLDAEFKAPVAANAAAEGGDDDAFKSLKATSMTKIADVLTQYKNTRAAIGTEQQRLLDDMTRIYAKAAQVVNELPGRKA